MIKKIFSIAILGLLCIGGISYISAADDAGGSGEPPREGEPVEADEKGSAVLDYYIHITNRDFESANNATIDEDREVIDRKYRNVSNAYAYFIHTEGRTQRRGDDDRDFSYPIFASYELRTFWNEEEGRTRYISAKVRHSINEEGVLKSVSYSVLTPNTVNGKLKYYSDDNILLKNIRTLPYAEVFDGILPEYYFKTTGTTRVGNRIKQISYSHPIQEYMFGWNANVGVSESFYFDMELPPSATFYVIPNLVGYTSTVEAINMMHNEDFTNAGFEVLDVNTHSILIGKRVHRNGNTWFDYGLTYTLASTIRLR